MTVQPQNEQVQNATQQPSDKELNFRRQEEMYKRQLEAERQARFQAEERAKQLEANSRKSVDDDDDGDDEPYVDKKRLKKQLDRFGKETMQQTQTEIQRAVNEALVGERRQQWLKNNPDYADVMRNENVEALANHDPELAETILQMPEGFERQKLVYKNIKNLGLHKSKEEKSSIQDTVDKNRKGPYYQPSSVGPPGYGNRGDFSQSGQKNAYDQMMALKKNLRI